MRIILLSVITVALPIAWLAAEFKAAPAIRRTLGVVTLLWSFGVAVLVGVLRDFNAMLTSQEPPRTCWMLRLPNSKRGNQRQWFGSGPAQARNFILLTRIALATGRSLTKP